MCVYLAVSQWILPRCDNENERGLEIQIRDCSRLNDDKLVTQHYAGNLYQGVGLLANLVQPIRQRRIRVGNLQMHWPLFADVIRNSAVTAAKSVWMDHIGSSTSSAAVFNGAKSFSASGPWQSAGVVGFNVTLQLQEAPIERTSRAAEDRYGEKRSCHDMSHWRTGE